LIEKDTNNVVLLRNCSFRQGIEVTRMSSANIRIPKYLMNQTFRDSRFLLKKEHGEEPEEPTPAIALVP
jgi:hypothetical protein